MGMFRHFDATSTTIVIFCGLNQRSSSHRPMKRPCHQAAPSYHYQGHKAKNGTDSNENGAFWKGGFSLHKGRVCSWGYRGWWIVISRELGKAGQKTA